tara:strand:+ start:12725 stop:12898 length:174 start_codon:yes stop_codon:yes gene_type:complete
MKIEFVIGGLIITGIGITVPGKIIEVEDIKGTSLIKQGIAKYPAIKRKKEKKQKEVG